MKYYIVTMLLWVGVVQVFAQQPRLRQVDEYLAATGQTEGCSREAVRVIEYPLQ